MFRDFFGKKGSLLKCCVLRILAPDYVRTKAENRRLRNDIHTLVMRYGKYDERVLRANWRMEFESHDDCKQCTYGDPTKYDDAYMKSVKFNVCGFFEQKPKK